MADLKPCKCFETRDSHEADCPSYNPAPVQAEWGLEVVGYICRDNDYGSPSYFVDAMLASENQRNSEHWDKLTGHAKATAALAQKDAEIAELKLELSVSDKLQRERVATLRAQLAEAEKDAQSWRQYQARKQAIIAAGMGKNPLRDADLSSQQEGGK